MRRLSSSIKKVSTPRFELRGRVSLMQIRVSHVQSFASRRFLSHISEIPELTIINMEFIRLSHMLFARATPVYCALTCLAVADTTQEQFIVLWLRRPQSGRQPKPDPKNGKLTVL